MSLTYRILALLLLSVSLGGQAQDARPLPDDSDSATIRFHRSRWDLDPSLAGNAAVLDSIRRKVTIIRGDSIFRLRRVNVIGGASPEGSERFNRLLSERRAATLLDNFRRFGSTGDAEISFTFLGRDWEGVLALCRLDPAVPFREPTIALLESIADEKRRTGREPDGSLERLRRLHGGVPYRYLFRNIFPSVRASRIIIDYSRRIAPTAAAPALERTILCHIDSVETLLPAASGICASAATAAPTADVTDSTWRDAPFFMNLRTNLLHDALLLPNAGAEIYLGRNMSVGLNWMYGWWSKDARHIYWRAYGGELFGRWWFGARAGRKPLTGLHVGVYAQYYMYDLELGGKGEMAGRPEADLWAQGMYGGGVDIGIAIPLRARINIDISLGVGYSGGEYHRYHPADTHYVWQGTFRRNFIGPTKAEVALVWLLGRGNRNARKGGGA